jgi:uncharacterized membrane protein
MHDFGSEMKSLFFPVLVLLLPTAASAFEKFSCFGTEPFWDAALEEMQISIKIESKRTYSGPKYGPPLGTSPDYVLSVQARSGSSNLTAFVVNETAMSVLTQNGEHPSSGTEYKAYCSDGMSDRGYPYSIHLIVDGKVYTGCCSTLSNPRVGQD